MKITVVKTKSTYFADDAEEYDYHLLEIHADGEVVGAVEVVDHLSDDNDVCYVERIDIDEAFRGKGIGTEVLTSTLNDECGYRYVVVAPDNEDAKRLYERIGEEYSFIPYCDQDFDYNDQGYGVYVI